MISLEGSLRTCKIDSGWANKVQSDRFLNPNNMLCPVWNGFDTAGRPAQEYSFYTKTPGCNSAGDRVLVENDLRPRYMEYISLDASGIRGGQDCEQYSVNGPVKTDAQCAQSIWNNTHQYAGQFGYVTGYEQNIRPNCLTCTDPKAAYESQFIRDKTMYFNSGACLDNRSNSGMSY